MRRAENKKPFPHSPPTAIPMPIRLRPTKPIVFHGRGGGQPMLNIPGQVTVLTRQILDDRNATSLKDALSSTAGVTVGR
jgi:outer membrane receptor protein involved in Fe transport